MFGPKRDEVTGEWRKLHIEELNDLHCTKYIWVFKSKRMIWAGHIASMGERRGAYRILVGRPDGKVRLGRTRCRWEDNIKTDLQDVGW
jgi:hypothetical protein